MQLKLSLKKHLFDILALLLAITSVISSYIVADRIYERIPHIEDEMAYVWQAKVITHGEITRPSPACPSCFLVPFVVDYQGQRFGKYPLGWPVILSFGIRFGLRDWVNPLITGGTIWLLYLLIKRLTDKVTALLGSCLAASSPFLLMNAGTLLSHPWSLFLTVALCLTWIDVTSKGSRAPGWMTSILAGSLLGCLVLTRPLSAVGVAIPFIVHALILLFTGEARQRKNVLIVALTAGVLSSLHFVWQYALTGDALLNPYTLWWNYDTVGFGSNIGRQSGGYMPSDIWHNLNVNLNALSIDGFGWFNVSWLFLPFGVISLRKNAHAWVVGGILPAVIFTYCFYWIGSWLFGPRYYYEGLPAFILFTAAGITWLVGRWKEVMGSHLIKILKNYRVVFVVLIVVLLVSLNIFLYLPQRLGSLKGLYGATRSRLEPFQTEDFLSKTPSLIIVHLGPNWLEYGTLLDLSDPYFESPYVFMIDQGLEKNRLATAQFPDRSIWLYRASVPNKLLSVQY